METKNCAVYVVLGYDVNGIKDILGIWIGESEDKHYWMQIFDEIKARGVSCDTFWSSPTTAMEDRLLMDFSITAVPGFQNRMQNLVILFSSREPM